MNVLFLYTEVAGYFLASAKVLYTHYGYNVHIVTKPNDPEAPYVFQEEEGVSFYQYKKLDSDGLLKLYEKLAPKFVYISGWGDRTYMRVAIKIRKTETPVICSCDNQWRGDARQILACIFKRGYLRRRFSHIFIAGIYQYPLAMHLGFKKKQIVLGMNTADLSLFHGAYEKYIDDKTLSYPHNFLYVGRFVEIKGLTELIEGFIELTKEIKHNWTLTLVGTGPLKSKLPRHEKIIYKDFLQQQELPNLAGSSGCFVLPSRIEPWGVVLHEFAGAGLPLVSTNICGAATAFIKPGFNGYLHEPKSKDEVKNSLLKIIEKSDKDLIEMGKRSHMLSYQITKESWASSLLSICK